MARTNTKTMTRPNIRHLLHASDYSGTFIHLAYLILPVTSEGRYYYTSIFYKRPGERKSIALERVVELGFTLKHVFTKTVSQAPGLGPSLINWKLPVPPPPTSVPSPLKCWNRPHDFQGPFQMEHSVIYWLKVSNQSLSFSRGRKTLYKS